MLQKFNPQKTKQLKKINAVLNLLFHEKKAREPLELRAANNILIIDPTLIGDLIMLIPFLQIIRKNAPNANITLVCGGWGQPVLKNQGLVDEFIPVDSKILNSPLKMILKWGKIKATIKEVNKKRYDIALEPRGDLRYIFFMHFCKSARKVSYNYTGGECFLTDVIQPCDQVKHLVEDKLFFARQLGCRFTEAEQYPHLSLTERQHAQNELFLKENGIDQKTIIGIHPGASLAIKQWDGFGELLKMLHREFADAVFLIFEGPGEGNAVERVKKSAEECGANFIVSRTGISEYVQRLAVCDAVVCNDSGAGHIAAAYGILVYVIFGPTLPELAKPYERDGVFVFSEDQLQCKPCMATKCSAANENACFSNITAELIVTAMLHSLNKEN